MAQLSAEAYMLRSSPEREFRIANVVLVAPDLDGDVAISKIFKVFSDPDLPFGERAEPAALLPPAPGLRSFNDVQRICRRLDPYLDSCS